MKKVFVLIVVASVCGAALRAQNKEDAFEAFKRQMNAQEEMFGEQRERDFEEFKARYYSAFEEFKKSYLRYLEDDVKVLDLMSSDDGLRIEPARLAPAPVAAADAGAQRKILVDRIAAVPSMTPEELLPVLSSQKDTLDRMREAAQVMEEIVADMNTVAVEENDTPVEVRTEVVLEPYDPEYFTSLPDVDELTVRTEEKQSPVEQEVKAEPAGGSSEVKAEQQAPAQEAAAPELSVPHGKPTEYVRISSPFGTRVHPITRKKHTHKGIDMAAPQMTPIYATADGVVTFSGRNGGYGNFVKLNHRNGYKTAYAHMHKIAVNKGADVRKGDLIGYVGTTGSSTGNHLHYEVYYQDKLIDPATTL